MAKTGALAMQWRFRALPRLQSESVEVFPLTVLFEKMPGPVVPGRHKFQSKSGRYFTSHQTENSEQRTALDPSYFR